MQNKFKNKFHWKKERFTKQRDSKIEVPNFQEVLNYPWVMGYGMLSLLYTYYNIL